MKNFESTEKQKTPIEVAFSLEEEFLRIKKIIKKYKWYVENRYNIDLPKNIKDKLEKSEDILDDDIKISIESEYNNDKYQKESDEIMKAWDIESPGFLEKLKLLERPLPDRFHIFITIYGTGGSYGYPNNIYLNINKKSENGILSTVFHEIIHLVIEDLIQEYNIPHWTKERLVNLTANKFFPDKQTLQRDPENTEQISEIFNRKFPDIKGIIEEISKMTTKV